MSESSRPLTVAFSFLPIALAALPLLLVPPTIKFRDPDAGGGGST